MRIIDSHVHLWDPSRMRIPWLDTLPTLNAAYTPETYAAHTAGLDIDALIYVQVDVAPAYGLVEAHEIAALAKSHPLIAGAVVYAPLEDGLRVRSYLDLLVELGPIIKGVRRLVQGEPDPAFCLRPDFVAGVQLLAEYGFSCDMCIYHPQLAATVELVRRCPNVSFILDHIGKPGIRAGEMEPWRAQLRALAALPNVVCKISGVVTEADHQHWQVDQVAPYMLHALDVFGEDRVLFGSDWPVVTLATPYTRWVEVLMDLTHDLSAEAQQKLWAENTRRVYKL